MDDERIFGPLTLRQFLYLAPGVILAYFAYTYFDQKISIPVIVIIAGVVFTLFRNAPVVIIDENYIKTKRYSCKNSEEFERWLHKKIAYIHFQVETRKIKSLPPDPGLESKLKMFEIALKDAE